MLDDYFVPTDGLDPEALLADWRWLIGNKRIAVVAAAAIGNLFLRGESGSVYLLDIEVGTCDRIADSVEGFRQRLGSRHIRRSWLYGFVVRELRQKGVLLAPGQCYGRKVPSRFGGSGGVAEDYEPTGLAAHISVLGQLHRQTRDLPPGTPINEIIVEGPPGD
jgi:hypothetical protein